ncbi:Oligopeptide ABC transport system, permease protein AppC [Nitrospina gracilis 3/211]|uniref:Oligopeptide ABC transport system, permease protein AppC n=1 Tax=Nitrospina gracilis (strain 3/211) TaxID=1266370 RepID=M1Z2A6_NITG3|nr:MULTISPECIES: ABC transporter permease [Nitrospina]MCF8722441.1 peptide/nickel transport system permease protein [Nitrospina sp. Nb-3]CCQ91866.1 Oligopeptide ABC transport system, permease protein AppC [Nitrospina gracilis 3/211]
MNEAASPTAETLAAEGMVPEETPFQERWRVFSRNKMALASMWFLAFLFVVAVGGKLLTMHHERFDPTTVRLAEKFKPPMTPYNTELVKEAERPLMGIYLLGTDELGRDVFARMLEGTFVSLTVGFVAVGISVTVGIFLGGLAGFYGRVRLGFITVDTIIMRFVDIMLCFPTFFLILTVVALLPPSIYNIMIVIGLTSWMGTARLVRAEFLALREQDYVLAAKSQAIPEMRIIFQHIVPNAIAPVLVSATIGVATAILTESALSFLGFGVQPPDATWGNILSDGKAFIFDAPWLTFIPGFTILFVVLAFNLFGEGLREAYNPKLRQR